jgi:hypothetical protein
MISRLYPTSQDFFLSLDRGMKLLEDCGPAPDESAKQDLKDLLSVFITATIEMDPKAVQDPDLGNKLAGVRLALLKAYNMGKEHAIKDLVQKG